MKTQLQPRSLFKRRGYMIGCVWRWDGGRRGSCDLTLSCTESFLFCILCQLFHSKLLFLHFCWIGFLFLANSSRGPVQGSWELPRSLTITSVKHLGDNWLGSGQTCSFFCLVSLSSLSLSPSLYNGDKDRRHTKKRSESLNPFTDQPLYGW